jgi:hypothetical protein
MAMVLATNTVIYPLPSLMAIHTPLRPDPQRNRHSRRQKVKPEMILITTAKDILSRPRLFRGGIPKRAGDAPPNPSIRPPKILRQSMFILYNERPDT